MRPLPWQVRLLRRRAAGLVAVGVMTAGATGCGSDGITSARVAAAVAPTFANLYSVHEASYGRSIKPASMRTHAVCGRGGPTQPANGPGEDWVCNLSWIGENGTPGRAAYALHVQNDACFSADGDGPADLNGQPTLVDADGKTVVNPVWEFDGCFNVG